jgi:hypothetical protein
MSIVACPSLTPVSAPISVPGDTEFVTQVSVLPAASTTTGSSLHLPIVKVVTGPLGVPVKTVISPLDCRFGACVGEESACVGQQQGGSGFHARRAFLSATLRIRT